MSKYTPEVARAAVERGGAWLERRCPGCLARIDLDILDLSNPIVCMLGQTEECIIGPATGDVVRGYNRVVWTLGWSTATAVSLGFNVPGQAEPGQAEYTTQFEMLTLTWCQYIRERLAETSPPNGVARELAVATILQERVGSRANVASS